jgi:general secretion pathway protein C
MSSVFNPRRFWAIVWLLGIIVLAKTIWVIAEWVIPLPVEGVVYDGDTLRHSLHYRYRLASDAKLKAPKKDKQTKVQKPQASLSSYRLVGIYSKKNYAVVTLVKGSKSFVLGTGTRGGEVEGYHLKDANATAATFVKGDQVEVLKLYTKKSASAGYSHVAPKAISTPAIDKNRATDKSSGGIVNTGDTTIIDRSLIRDYSQHPDKIWKNIGLYEVKHDGKLDGFKVRFVRRGSPFEKLGLKRGDVIKSINGEPIVDYATPMRMLRSADAIDDLSITVKRNNEEQELRYEVK